MIISTTTKKLKNTSINFHIYYNFYKNQNSIYNKMKFVIMVTKLDDTFFIITKKMYLGYVMVEKSGQLSILSIKNYSYYKN
jgi:hypothetical protein